jgi:hypothetical protein
MFLFLYNFQLYLAKCFDFGDDYHFSYNKKTNNKTLWFLLLNKVVCLFCLSNHDTFDYVLGNVIKLSTSRGAPRCFHIV